MLSDVLFKLKLKDGYLLKIVNCNQFEIHHENGNGCVKFNSKESLLDYVVQIGGDFEITDISGNILGQ